MAQLKVGLSKHNWCDLLIFSTAPEDFKEGLYLLSFTNSISKACVNITIEDDSILEDSENFTVTITSGDPDVSFETAEAKISIMDNDNITIGFEMEKYSAREDQESVEVCARVREGILQRRVSVLFSTKAGDASSPEDYANTSILLSFDGNNERDCVNISITNDMTLEGVEVFEVILNALNEPRVILSPQRAEVSITDDDGQFHHVIYELHCDFCEYSLHSCHHWIRAGGVHWK